MFVSFRLKGVFLVTIALKNKKQIDHELADRDVPSSTFKTLLVKFRPNVLCSLRAFELDSTEALMN